MTTRHMRIAFCLTKATDTHPEYVILTAFPLQQWLHEHASMLRYTYIAFLVKTTIYLGYPVLISARRPYNQATVSLNLPQSLQVHLGRETYVKTTFKLHINIRDGIAQSAY